jgi:hypothetical protein
MWKEDDEAEHTLDGSYYYGSFIGTRYNHHIQMYTHTYEHFLEKKLHAIVKSYLLALPIASSKGNRHERIKV